MGTIKTTNIETITGSGTLTLGQSGETISVPSGATLDLSSATQTGVGGVNTPAFYARASTDQTLSDNTVTTVVFDTEYFDTNNAFASNTFTVPSGEAGKYFFRWSINYINPNSTGYRSFYLKKNSTVEIENGKVADDTARNFNTGTIMLSLSVGDTISIEGYQNSGTNMTLNRIGGTDKNGIHFGGFKLIG